MQALALPASRVGPPAGVACFPLPGRECSAPGSGEEAGRHRLGVGLGGCDLHLLALGRLGPTAEGVRRAVGGATLRVDDEAGAAVSDFGLCGVCRKVCAIV